MKKVLVVLFLLITQVGQSCINGKGFDIFGGTNFYGRPLFTIKKMMPADYQKRIAKQELELKNHSAAEKTKWDYFNEVAILNIYKGEYAEAKKMLFKASRLDTFNYSVCSNLGVVYELMGNLDSAYYYTSAAVKMFPRSHGNSEWIHLKILEATKKIKTTPTWIYDNSVIGFKFAKSELPSKRYSFGQDTAKNEYYDHYVVELIGQIEYQLRERMVFVKPENKIVANLLFTLGELYITEIDCEKAEEVYKLAMEYDPALTEICNKRMDGVLYHLSPFAKQVKKAREESRKAYDKSDIANAFMSQAKIKQIYSGLELTLAQINLKKYNQKKYSILSGGAILLIVASIIIVKKRKRKKSLHP